MRVLDDVVDPTAEMPRWRSWGEALLKPASGQIASLLERMFGPRTQGTIGVLMYHRISPIAQGLPRPTWNVPPEQFQRQLAGLAARGYQAWPLSRIVEHHATGQPFPRRTFAITFDDGYENIYHYAWPVLKQFSWPATVFIPTQYLDSDRPLPFESWPAAGSTRAPASTWRPLTTRQCQEMLVGGLISLGTHTHSHADFRGRPGALSDDLKTSLGLLAERFGLKQVPLAFPFGRKHLGFSGPPLVAAARQRGVTCALTTESELISAHSDPFDWGRFTVTEYDTAATIAMKLEGWYGAARSVWRKVRSTRKETPRNGDSEHRLRRRAS